MKQAKFKAEVDMSANIEFEFGRVQGRMWLSNSGSIARKLKLKDEDKVEITIKVLGKKK